MTRQPSRHSLLSGNDSTPSQPARKRIPSGHTRDANRTHDRATWVDRCSEREAELKSALAKFAATHLISYANVIQLGSGTTLNALMDRILDIQLEKGESSDLVVLTSNLTVLEKGLQELGEHADIFSNMQLILTGGAWQSSLSSLVGEFAAEGVRTQLIRPHAVFFGALGLSFAEGGLTLSYQFADEIATQVAYATRPTDRRVVLCDHTKLGKRTGWNRHVAVESILDSAQECSIISTYPDNAVELEVVMQESKHFEQILVRLAENPAYKNKDLSLILIDKDAKRVRAWSLSDHVNRSLPGRNEAPGAAGNRIDAPLNGKSL